LYAMLFRLRPDSRQPSDTLASAAVTGETA
jgi:hypothetical protein